MAEEAGAGLAAYSEGVSTAAREAGVEAPSAEELEQAFAASVTDGSGSISRAEAQAAEVPIRNCGGGGICRHGQCFCAAAPIIESDEAENTASENPILQNPAGASEYGIGD